MAKAWHVFRRAPSRGGRGRPATADFVVCFGSCGIFLVFFFRFFFFNCARPAVSMRTPCLIYLSTTSEIVFLLLDEELFLYRGAYRVTFGLFVCLNVCLSVCLTVCLSVYV